ncbi:MAG: hypothetical protein FWC43_04780 [Planctomycetaceae bacterium]|nr:hypothetical protein [Planctomycetaceae bacterium]
MKKQTRLQFVREMIIKLRTALLNADPTVTNISVDGDSTAYNVEQANKLLEKYEEEERRLSGKFSTLETIDMGRM